MSKELGKVPNLLYSSIPATIQKRLRYIRYVLRVGAKGKETKRVLGIDAGDRVVPPNLFLATTDGRVKRVVSLHNIEQLRCVYLTGGKLQTLIIQPTDEEMLLIRTPDMKENPTKSKIGDLRDVINKVREKHELEKLEMELVEQVKFKYVSGKKYTPSDWVERCKEERDKQEAEVEAIGEQLPGQRDSRGTECDFPKQRSNSITTYTNSEGTDGEKEEGKLGEIDQSLKDATEELIRKAYEKRKELSEAMRRLKQDANSAPPQTQLDQAADDASMYDDETLATTFVESEYAPSKRTEVLDRNALQSMMNTTDNPNHRSADQRNQSSLAPPSVRPPAHHSSRLNDVRNLSDGQAKQQLESVPWDLQLAASQRFAPGGWSAMPERDQLQAIVDMTQLKFVIRKSAGEAIGVATRNNIITEVGVGSPAWCAGLHNCVGFVIERLNGRAVNGDVDLSDVESYAELVVRPGDQAEEKVLNCKHCAGWVGYGDRYCSDCGKPLREATRAALGRSRNRETTLRLLQELADSMDSFDAVMQCTGATYEQQEMVVRNAAEHDLLQRYVRSVVKHYEEMSEGSVHSSDDALRCAPGERRLWGRRPRMVRHPAQRGLVKALEEKEDIAEELDRLRGLREYLASGECVMNLERYKLHLQTERHVLLRWLAGTSRCKGAMGDPRYRMATNTSKVVDWLEGVVHPDFQDAQRSMRVPSTYVRESTESEFVSYYSSSSGLRRSSSFYTKDGSFTTFTS